MAKPEVTTYEKPRIPIDWGSLKAEDYYPACNSWANLAEDLLELAKKCLVNTPGGVPASCFVWDDIPDGGCQDFLSVHPHTYRPINQKYGLYPEENFQKIQADCNKFYWAPRFEITWGRNCRPVVANSRTDPTGVPDAVRTKWGLDRISEVETLSCCMLQKIHYGYELDGKEWPLSKVFFQQAYSDGHGIVGRYRFRVMFDTQNHCECCKPKGKSKKDWWKK